MDVGEYESVLQAVLRRADYPALREEQARRRADPVARQLGIGLSTYVAIANSNALPEYGRVAIGPDGSALVLTGSSDHG